MATAKKKSAKRGASKPSTTTTTAAWAPKIGDAVCIRTVTHYHVGVYAGSATIAGTLFIALDRAAWVADTGRFSQFLATGSANEVEPFNGPCIVNPGSTVDISPWRHALLEVVK